MSTAAAPPPTRALSTPLIRPSQFEQKTDWKRLWRLIPALGVSALFHGLIIAVMFFLVSAPAPAEAPVLETVPENQATVQSEPPPEPIATDPLTVTDIDPNAIEPDVNINYDVERIADVSVPGLVDPNAPIGIENGDMSTPPMNIPAPPGFGSVGQGGPMVVDGMASTSDAVGSVGGYHAKGTPAPGNFFGRSGATRERALRNGGGTKESEVAVAKGLNWLIRVQSRDGAWRIDGPFPDKGNANDTAGTAFGLLPFLGAGKTHKASKENPFDKPIERALAFLLRQQDAKTGNLGGGMYAHALAAIALSEAYGLTQDPALRRPAQMALNYLVAAQHAEGGWRYSPGQAGDTSVTGWCVMALKSGKMGGLDVPEITFRKAVRYLDSCRNPQNEGYGYVGTGATPTMSAVGLLCRQYLQSWGPQTLKMIKGIEAHVKKLPPGRTQNMYYYYYATQVMHHYGGDDWKTWNTAMRDTLVKHQQKSNNPYIDGSWAPAGGHAAAGGRLMETSLSLLTLEVYYRYLPLYYREAGERQQKLLMGS